MGAAVNFSINWNLAGMPPQAMRARCSAFRYCPDPLGIVPAEVFDKLEFVYIFLLMLRTKAFQVT